MEPKIVNKKAFTVVGTKYHGKNENNEIKQMWQGFGPRVQEIKNVVNAHVCYGVCGNMDESTCEFDYVAGLEVDSVTDIPEGMVRWDIPESAYAVFTCTLPTVGEAYQHAFEAWLPQSRYQHTGSPDFELYDESFDPNDPNSTFEIYIPVK